jgi:hypothetical protein
LRRNSRWILTILAGLSGAGFLSPLVQSWLQRWPEPHGYQLPLTYVTPAISKLADMTQTADFVFVTGFFIGGALLLWVDHALRRRTRDMGLILAGIGLATFAVGLGIYFFPPLTGAQLATNTPPSAVPPTREADPLVWSKTPILGWNKQADGTLYARSFGVVGKNVGSEDVQLDEIYLVSGITGARIELKVQIPDEGMFPVKETNPIPPDAFIQLSSDEFNSSGGISEPDFLKDWGAINFFAVYGGQKHRMIFDRATIAGLFDAQRPTIVPPHVSRKPAPVTQANAVLPPPEQTVQPAQATQPSALPSGPVTQPNAVVPPPEQTVQPAQATAPSTPPSVADIRKRKRDLLRDYAEMINGPFVAVVRQGRAICDDWNALGGLNTQQFYDRVTDFKVAMTEAFAQMDDRRRKYQMEDAELMGPMDWTFDKIFETTDVLLSDLPPLFSLDDKSARAALLDNGLYIEWAVAIGDFDQWIATKRKIIADKARANGFAEASGDAK